ncbi:MAG: NUDIX domain-containing protein [Actinocrinis sp.]
MTDTEAGRWKVREHPITLPSAAVNRHSRLTVANVELPDGVEFSQVVLRVDAASMCVLVNERAEVLMKRRHRFIPDLDVWELPGGYLNEGEDAAAAAVREAVEETGWRPGRVEHLVTFEPMTGTASAPNHVYLGLDPQRVDGAAVDVNESGELRWIALADVPAMIGGMTLGAASVIGLLAARDRLGVR